MVCVAIPVLVACATATAGSVPVVTLDTGWSCRAGFDPAWLTDSSSHGWVATSGTGSWSRVTELQGNRGPVTARYPIGDLVAAAQRHRVVLALRTGQGGDVREFYVGSRQIASCGSVAPYVPGIDRDIIAALPTAPFDTAAGQFLTVVYHQSTNVGFFGTRTPAHIGPADDIYREYYRSVIVGFVLFALVGLVALYHVLLGLLRQKDPYYLLFGICSAAFAAFLATNTPAKQLLFAHHPLIEMRIDLLSVILMAMALPLFVVHLIPGRGRTPVYWYAGAMGALMGVALLADSTGEVLVRRAWEYGLLLLAPWLCAYVGYYAWKGNYRARVLLGGIIVSVIAGTHDTMAYKGLVEFHILAPVAYLAIVLSVALLLVQQFVSVHSGLEQLNARLEERVRSRTEELQASLRDKDRILGVVAHDLKNPVTAIKASSDILKLECKGAADDFAREVLGIIDEAVARSESNIDELLNMARLDDTTRPLFTEEVDLAEFLDVTCRAYKTRAHEKHIRFTHDVPPVPLMVRINKSMFTRVVDNLLSNAMKFTPEGGAVALTAQRTASGVRIVISDSGIGIPNALQAHVFERFGPASRPGTNKERSTGLGLSIVKGVVDRHGGTVQFESVEGKGTTFIVDVASATPAAT